MSNAFCISFFDDVTISRSSACINTSILRFPMVIPISDVSSWVIRLSAYIANRYADAFPPCFNPTVVLNSSEYLVFAVVLLLVALAFLIIENELPFCVGEF